MQQGPQELPDAGRSNASIGSAPQRESDADDAQVTKHVFGYEAGPMEIAVDFAAVARSVARLSAALKCALADVGTPAYRRMQQAGMRAEVGWEGPAVEWHAFIEEVAGSEHSM